MPLRSDAVGQPLPAVTVPVTPRMALAYSAGIGEVSEAGLDDANPMFAALPMFCVSLEWRLVVAVRDDALGVAETEARRVVHVGQDSHFLGPLRPGRAVIVTGRLEEVRRTRVGALAVTRLDTVDAETGAPLVRTLSTALYRGVAVIGDDRLAEPRLESALTGEEAIEVLETTIPLDRGFAHRYSECAAIWNPIHTERAHALEADLPDIIVHGTALWALAGRTLVARFSPAQPLRLRRLSGRFSAMVTAGTPITIRHARSTAAPGRAIFSVLNSEGREAVSEGVAEFHRA